MLERLTGDVDIPIYYVYLGVLKTMTARASDKDSNEIDINDECAVETSLDCRRSIESETRLVGVCGYMLIIHVAFSIYVFMRSNVMHYYAQAHPRHSRHPLGTTPD